MCFTESDFVVEFVDFELLDVEFVDVEIVDFEFFDIEFLDVEFANVEFVDVKFVEVISVDFEFVDSEFDKVLHAPSIIFVLTTNCLHCLLIVLRCLQAVMYVDMFKKNNTTTVTKYIQIYVKAKFPFLLLYISE